MRIPQTSLAGVAIVLACTAIVTVRVVLAPGPTALRAATAEERAEIAHTIAAAELGWTNETTQNFPADNWSQSDDFHGREYRKVQEISKDKKIRIEDVLRAIDDDIHHPTKRPSSTLLGGSGLAPATRHAEAVPCKPRPFYD